MNKLQAATKRAEWLKFCLEIGWDKSELGELAAIWDEHKDEYGNLRPVKQKVESTSPTPLIKALQAIYSSLDIGIPYYAYGDNEAACSMAQYINQAREYAGQALSSFESLHQGEGWKEQEEQDEIWVEFVKDVLNSGVSQEEIKSKFIITKRV